MLINALKVGTTLPSIKTKFTEAEVRWLAEAAMLGDDAPPGLLEKLSEMERKFDQVRRYYESTGQSTVKL